MHPLSLYIHVPFCTRRCSYCSFYHVPAARDREARFVDSLGSEIEAAFAELGEGVELRTVFVGGGTPTVLERGAWERILAAIAPRFPSGGPEEFTVEMNPEDVAADLVGFLRGLGVNRASLGVQSMHGVGQKVLKRCAPEVNARAIETVRRAFDNVSFDLLLGVPKTTPADLRRGLQTLLEYRPRHFSVYGLEPGGDRSREVERFFGAVDPDRIADEYLEVCALLQGRGYEHYEVSNFAQPGFQSRHNRVYWDGGDYLGVGPAAHSSIAGRRFWNEPSLERYLSRRGPEHLRARMRDEGGDERIERAMLALRTDRGAPRAWLAADEAALGSFIGEGLAWLDEGRVRLTDRGYLVLNDVVLRLTGTPTC
jgi:oxygen-independent coproporphyrinogen-3 oxidase